MAGSLNKVVLIGNLGADPEIRTTNSGKQMCTMSIATSDRWRDKASGEQRERTEWHRVVIFSEGLTRIAEQYLNKGSKVYIEGQLQTRKWQDQNSEQDRYVTEVVLQGFNSSLIMLSERRGGSGGGGGGNRSGGGDGGGGGTSNDGGGSGGNDVETNNNFDDDIPF